MDPHDPASAHRIVAEYVGVLEHSHARPLPASVRTLPYPKQTIKAAIFTCFAALRSSEQLTEEMREFLEESFVALADYVDDDLVQVMVEYRQALRHVADVPAARDKLQTPEWRRIAETSRLAGDIARTIANDSAALRVEFRAST